MFRWAHFTCWQGEPFPAYLRKTDRLPQAESLGITCFPRSARMFCLSLLVPGQYAATWGKYALLQWSGGGHHAAELGCGRLRRCPVIRPVTDRGMRDTPYDRRRTLTAAYRAGACLSLDDFPAVSSQRLFTQPLFLDLRRIDFGALSFPAVSRRWQVPRQNSKQKRRKNLPAVSASYDPSCVCSIVQF